MIQTVAVRITLVSLRTPWFIKHAGLHTRKLVKFHNFSTLLLNIFTTNDTVIRNISYLVAITVA
jgi:hypothetical protein